jgi:ABC-type multidrug transport system ATPase subunit
LSSTECLTAKADGLAECTASLEKIVEEAKTLYGSLGEGEVHRLLGDNGAGKSTLIKHCRGFTSPRRAIFSSMASP